MNNNTPSRKELLKKITEKKEFSQLPEKDVEKVFEKFDKESYADSEKVKLTRDLLRKIYSGFTSQKLLSLKDKDPEWILRKHLSTRERLPYYSEVYEKILDGWGTQGRTSKNIQKNIFTGGKISVIDLGAGINGFSYNFFNESGFKVSYIGIEAMGQLVVLMKDYFHNLKVTSKNKIKWNAIHMSLFELEKIKQLIKKTAKPRVIFLFKILDSLEMLESDYSKKILSELTPLVDRVVVSFATKSMLKRTRFKVNRKWIVDFIQEKFNLVDDFEIGGERYIVLKSK